MTKVRLESLRTEMQKCTRCSLCKMVPMPTVQDAKYANACPPVTDSQLRVAAHCGGGTFGGTEIWTARFMARRNMMRRSSCWAMLSATS